MPILPPEPDYYPADLWETLAARAPADGSVWWCLHTKPRQEKSIARELLRAHVSFYLPQARKESRSPQGRRTESLVPLFPSYMFMKGGKEDRLVALRGNRIVTVLEVADQEALTRDLLQVQRMVSSGLMVTEEPTIPVGASVRVTTGPLTGLIGTIIRRANGEDFVASVRFLGRGATVHVAGWQVERIPE